MIKDTDIIKLNDIKQFDSNDLEKLLHKILNYVKSITKSEAGTIYLKDGNNLKFNIFQNDSFSYETIFKLQEPLKNLTFPIEENTNTISVESYIHSKIITVDDIYEDGSYDFKSAKDFDEQFSYKTKSILTAPLLNIYTKEVIGVIQLINKKEQDQFVCFNEDDREFISLSSYFIALSINTTQDSISKLQKANDELEQKVIQRTKKLELAQQRLIEQANRDPMTNLYNRRYFNEMIHNLIQISQRENQIISILMIDIDNFKNINDTYGHSIGDDVINVLANILKTTVRTSDIAVRFGGEEFVIVLPNTSVENSLIIAEKLRQTVEDKLVTTKERIIIKFTISIGISIIEKNNHDIDLVLHKADQALYKSKKEGKNQVNFLI